MEELKPRHLGRYGMDFHDIALAGETEPFRPDRQRAQHGYAFGNFITGQVSVLMRDVAADGVLVFLKYALDVDQRGAPRAKEVVVDGG